MNPIASAHIKEKLSSADPHQESSICSNCKTKETGIFRVSCPYLGLALLLLLLFAILTLATLGLAILVVNSESLVDLGLKSGIILDAMNELALCQMMTTSFDRSCTYRLMSSEFSISRSIPVILPASSPLIA